MGPDEKDTGPLTVYMDGRPVGIAGGEIPEISLTAEEPVEAVPSAAFSGGSATITLEQASEAMKSLAGVWDAICTTLEQAGKALARVWAACREALEFQEAMRWASVYDRPLAYRYRHTKKKRTRKKYAKRILACIGRRSCKCYGLRRTKPNFTHLWRIMWTTCRP